MTVRAVLFDIDGTLVDSNEYHVQAWQRAFEASGFKIPPSVIRQQIGKGADMLIPTLLPESDERLRQQIDEHHGKAFRNDYLQQVRPFARASELVRRVAQRGCATLLASSANQVEVDHYVDLLDLRSVLIGTTSADDVTHSKPAKDIFAAAMKKLPDARPEETLVIGDTPYDIIAATKCGLRTIAVRSGGFPVEQLRDAGAVAIYNDVAHLLEGFETSPLAA